MLLGQFLNYIYIYIVIILYFFTFILWEISLSKNAINDGKSFQFFCISLFQQQKLLVKERTVGDYKIYRCINCATDTHSVHKFKGLERVVANKDLVWVLSY